MMVEFSREKEKAWKWPVCELMAAKPNPFPQLASGTVLPVGKNEQGNGITTSSTQRPHMPWES